MFHVPAHKQQDQSKAPAQVPVIPAQPKQALYMEVIKPERADGRKAGKYTLSERKNCVTGEVSWMIRRQPINPKTGKPWQAPRRIATFDKPGLAVRAFIKV